MYNDNHFFSVATSYFLVLSYDATTSSDNVYLYSYQKAPVRYEQLGTLVTIKDALSAYGSIPKEIERLKEFAQVGLSPFRYSFKITAETMACVERIKEELNRHQDEQIRSLQKQAWSRVVDGPTIQVDVL